MSSKSADLGIRISFNRDLLPSDLYELIDRDNSQRNRHGNLTDSRARRGEAPLSRLDKLLVDFKREPSTRIFVEKVSGAPHYSITLRASLRDDAAVREVVNLLTRKGIPKAAIIISYPAPPLSEQLEKAIRNGARLSFGRDVAESENRDLSAYFVQTPDFLRVMGRERHIIIGPKGAGKSAILSQMRRQDEDEGTLAIVVTPEQYATELIRGVAKEVSGETVSFTTYVTAWRYALLVEILRQLVAQSNKSSAEIRAFRDYLVERRLLESKLTLLERFLDYFRQIKALKLGVGAANVSFDVQSGSNAALDSLHRMTDLLPLVPKLQKALARKPVSVYVDELDQSWDNSKSANDFLSGLFKAVLDLRGDVAGLNVAVFIRSEVFDRVAGVFPHLDKIRSATLHLNWSAGHLRTMLLRRASLSLGLSEVRESQSEMVRAFFPPSMPDDASLSGLDYLISRTSRRPRELIQFANLAVENVWGDDERRGRIPVIDHAAIMRAEEVFSKWKLEHIQAEYLYIYPQLGSLFELFRGKQRRLQRNQLTDILATALMNAHDDVRAAGWLRQMNDYDELVRVLYSIEFVGIRRPDASESHMRLVDVYEFSYERPDARAESADSFLVHPALWKTLQLQP